MAIYIVRACRALPGKNEEVKKILESACANTPTAYVCQSVSSPSDFGIFAHFDDEATARAFGSSTQPHEAKLAPLIEGATGVTILKPI